MAQVIICAGISVMPYIRPVGTFQLANILRQAGYTVQVIDQFPWIANEGIETVKTLFDKFVGPETLWIGYSSTWFRIIREMQRGFKEHMPGGIIPTSWHDLRRNTLLFTDEEIIDLRASVHKKNPNVKFVLGGARSSSGRRALFSPLIDIYIEGYADNTALRLTRWLDGEPNIDIKPVKPIAYSAGFENDYIFSIRDDPKATGFDYNNHRFTWHENDLVNWGETLPMEIARGCVFNCAFCSYPLNGRKKMDYLKDPLILREQLIENYERFGTTNYFFLDDTFNESEEKLELLAEHTFSKLDFRPRFGAFMRVDLIAHNPRQIQLLNDIGVSGAFFGIESLNYEANKSVGKGIKKEKLLECLYRLQDEWPSDVITDAQFIMGLPNDNEETILEWLDEVLTDDFPLDAAKIEPLHLNKNSINEIWVSKFAEFPERYGYTFPDNEKPYNWVNNMGFSANDAVRIKNSKPKQWAIKEKTAFLGDYGLMNIGVPADVIEARRYNNLPFAVGQGSDYQTRKAFVKNYIKRLLALEEE